MSELVSNGVQIYQFPTEDEAVAEINSSMNVSPKNRKQKNICTVHLVPNTFLVLVCSHQLICILALFFKLINIMLIITCKDDQLCHVI